MKRSDLTRNLLRADAARKYWTVRASLLVVLESHRGRWNTRAFLAGRVVAPVLLVEMLCDDLVAHGETLRSLYFGEPIYGLDISADYPGINDARDLPAQPGQCVGGFSS